MNHDNNANLQDDQFSKLILNDKFTLHQLSLNQDDSSEINKLIKNTIQIMQSSFQFLINDFIVSMKRDQVPIQKTIIKNLNLELERQIMTLKVITGNKIVIQKILALLFEDCSLLLHTLCQTTKPILEFFDQQFIDEIEIREINTIEINLYYFQEPINQKIINFCLITMNLPINSIYLKIFENSSGLFKQLTNELCDQISMILNQGRNYVEILKTQFNDKTILSYVMNKYMILQLFLELSSNCYQVVQDLLEFTIFHYSEPDVNEGFMKYIIENHDILFLKIKEIEIEKNMISSKTNKCQDKQYNQKNDMDPNTKQMVEQCLRQLNSLITSKQKSLSVYRVSYKVDCKSQQQPIQQQDQSLTPTQILAQHMAEENSYKFQIILQSEPKESVNQVVKLDTKSFQKGLYIECEDPQFRFIIFMEQYSKNFKIIYAPLVSKRWTFEKTYVVENGEGQRYFSNQQKAGWVIQPIKFDCIKDLTNSPWMKDQLLLITRWKDLEFSQRVELSKKKKFEGEMDTMFGFFIANIFRTNHLQQYLKEFGLTAVNNGCMLSLIQDIPIIGEFLNVGGFGQQALQTHITIRTPQRKIVPITRLVITTGTSLGSAVSGAIIGQFLIPIPLFGTIVGGILGGYIGNRGVNNFLRNHNQKKAYELTKKLEQLQIRPEGYWEYSKLNVDILQISIKQFTQLMPKSLMCNDNNTAWLNMIIFSFMTIYFTTLKNLADWESPKTQQRFSDQNQQWPETLEHSQRWMIAEKINILPCLDDIKSIIEIIVKNI